MNQILLLNQIQNANIANVAFKNESNTFAESNTFSKNITTEGLLLEADNSHRVYDNATCVFITGSTSTLKIC